MNRREFCRNLSLYGGSIVMAPLLKACAPQSVKVTEAPATTLPKTLTATQTPIVMVKTRQAQIEETMPSPTPAATATPHPEPTPLQVDSPGMARVALVRTDNRAEGVKQVIELLGLNPAKGKHVLLKPNLNSADEAPGSTHPDVLRALVGKLLDMDARSILVGDRSGMGNTRAVMQQKGVLKMADALGFRTVVFDELGEDDWVLQQSTDFHWTSGFAVPKLLLDAECVVQTCNLKTHRYGGHFTLSLKNSVGLAAKFGRTGYNYMNELHNSPFQRLMIAEINSAYSPDLIVLDGVEAFVNGGPATGKKANPGVVLATTDRVAMDAVGVAILRLLGTTPEVSQGKVFDQEQIFRAVELGLGVNSPENIQFLVADEESHSFAEKVSQILIA